MDGTFKATAKFQDSDFFQKAIEMALRCILHVNSLFQDLNFNLASLMQQKPSLDSKSNLKTFIFPKQ